MGAPWFKFFPSQYLSDSKVKMLSRDHRSILLDLWCYCSQDGGIPSDVLDLARLIGETPAITKKAMGKLSGFFVVDGDRLVSVRLQAEAEAYGAKCQKLRESAKRGGESKQANAVANAVANARPDPKQMPKQNPTEAEAEEETEKETTATPTPSGQGPVAEEVAKPRGKKPAKPKGRDFAIAALGMPAEVEAQFNRAWSGYPKQGWNFTTKQPAPRRINYAEASKRYLEVLTFCPIRTVDGSPITAADLTDATLAWVAQRVREARRDNSEVPNVPCIANFFSSVEGSKHHWKEALLEHFDVLPEAACL